MGSVPGQQDRYVATRAVGAASLAVFVGIGLSRFAYSPLIPAIVEAGWFTAGEAAYLGAANLSGYLLGALGGRRMVRRASPRAALRILMLLASATFLAGAFPQPFAWFFAWRLLSGVAGGGLMVLAAPLVLSRVPAERKGRAAGMIFAGVGAGIILSGTLVPALLGQGLAAAWLGLGGVAFLATATAWCWWPAPHERPSGAIIADAPRRSVTDAARFRDPGLIAICLTYGLIAVGLVPHMVFLVDYIARGLGEGVDIGGRYWVAFGLGALLGPVLAGRLADHVGFGAALRWLLGMHVLGVGALAVDQSGAVLAASSVMVGSAVSGTVPLVLGQTQERVSDPQARIGAWGIATASFALGQAVAGYAYAHLFAASGEDFRLLFLVGSIALGLALATNALVALFPRGPRSLEGDRP